MSTDSAVLYADIGKVKNILNWKPEKSLEDSIKSGLYVSYFYSKNEKNKNNYLVFIIQ